MSALRSVSRHSPPTLTRRIPVPGSNRFSTDDTPRHDQTLRLPDGRLLGFAEYGSSTGKPLLYFHGYPSSRLEAGPIDAMAQRLGIRILALDRPGFGLSSPLPQSQIRDWPLDVQAFASEMKLSKFAVMGLSGGGPFALACAKELPQEMLTGVGLFASAPPWAAGRHHMSLSRRILSWMSFNWPSGLKIAANVCLKALGWLTSTNFVTSRIDGWLSRQKPQNQDATQPERPVAERRENLFRLLFKEPFVQGSDAAAHETLLLSSNDWGFRLEDVSYDKVLIWHGVKDANAPIVMMRYLADKLPHCELYELPDDTHYTMFKHLEDALAKLVSTDA